MFPKFTFLLWICFLQQVNSNILHYLKIGTGCISTYQLTKATQILCENKSNATLWQQAIDCHNPVSEKFLRESGEAQCPYPKNAENPLDPNFSIQDVFFNICGVLEGNLWDRVMGYVCILFGKENVLSHYDTVKTIKLTWGDEVPCNIGKCILDMGLNL